MPGSRAKRAPQCRSALFDRSGRSTTRPDAESELTSFGAVNVDISLIIGTRDRCQQLARCLQSVRHIAFERPWELIIVDNGSTDGTADSVREFMTTACNPVRY